MQQKVIKEQAIARAVLSLIGNVEKAFKGKRDVILYVVSTLLANGHVLLEDLPGTGKTTLVVALARSLGLSFKRIQFTSDLMPSDITGVNIFDSKKGGFVFQKGPIFANIVLADEINRATPKTQSSLLEAMNEYQVTVDNETHRLPSPFFVIATENPLEVAGTYPLPESQLDRFTIRLEIGYPEVSVEKEIIKDFHNPFSNPLQQIKPVISHSQLENLMTAAGEVKVGEKVLDYILALVNATRRKGGKFYGLSTRAALHLYRVSKALALLKGRNYVIPDDIKELFIPVCAHRIIGSALGVKINESKEHLKNILNRVEVPF